MRAADAPRGSLILAPPLNERPRRTVSDLPAMPQKVVRQQAGDHRPPHTGTAGMPTQGWRPFMMMCVSRQELCGLRVPFRTRLLSLLGNLVALGLLGETLPLAGKL
ncbi:MAG: hypothetical protein QOF41_168 [Methylobacteriaceae bacterium]|nr:hypothetical protein [Methylobacteriaceae bacterium]